MPLDDVNCETEMIFCYTVICFVPGILKNKCINKILPLLLYLVIHDMLILHVDVLPYSYCETVEREIKGTLPLIDRIGLNADVFYGMRYTDFKGLPSGILLL